MENTEWIKKPSGYWWPSKHNDRGFLKVEGLK